MSRYEGLYALQSFMLALIPIRFSYVQEALLVRPVLDHAVCLL